MLNFLSLVLFPTGLICKWAMFISEVVFLSVFFLLCHSRKQWGQSTWNLKDKADVI